MKYITAPFRFLWYVLKHFWRAFWYRPVLLAWGAVGWFWLWCVTHAQHVTLPLFFLACMLLGGCATTSTRAEAETTRSNRYHLVGEVRVPVATAEGYTNAPVPLDITVEHEGTEKANSSSQSETKLDMSALSGLIVAGIKQACPALGAFGTFMGPPKPQGMSSSEIAAIVTALTTAVAGTYAVTQNKRANEHKADATEGWNRATGKTP